MPDITTRELGTAYLHTSYWMFWVQIYQCCSAYSSIFYSDFFASLEYNEKTTMYTLINVPFVGVSNVVYHIVVVIGIIGCQARTFFVASISVHGMRKFRAEIRVSAGELPLILTPFSWAEFESDLGKGKKNSAW
ncbi:hypothetical protein DFS33DRAFT_1277016 [Desarmillaria ectypa]|nr:hypothetical protein DFS33DRAFT_1277016 [Desarmillaria ectypa]